MIGIHSPVCKLPLGLPCYYGPQTHSSGCTAAVMEKGEYLRLSRCVCYIVHRKATAA